MLSLFVFQKAFSVFLKKWFSVFKLSHLISCSFDKFWKTWIWWISIKSWCLNSMSFKCKIKLFVKLISWWLFRETKILFCDARLWPCAEFSHYVLDLIISMWNKVWNFSFWKRWIIQIKSVISIKFQSNFRFLLNDWLLYCVLLFIFFHFFNRVNKCSNHFFNMSKLSLFCFCLSKEIYNQVLIYQVINPIVLS